MSGIESGRQEVDLATQPVTVKSGDRLRSILYDESDPLYNRMTNEIGLYAADRLDTYDSPTYVDYAFEADAILEGLSTGVNRLTSEPMPNFAKAPQALGTIQYLATILSLRGIAERAYGLEFARGASIALSGIMASESTGTDSKG
jgi:hypothetical protein